MILENVNKSFQNKQVLTDFSAEFPGGKITAVMGRSGCGKTTLLRLILGLDLPDSGRILENEGKKAAVFQEDRLVGVLNGVENVRLGRQGASREEAMELLTALGLKDHAEKSVSSLSGGMRRRVAIARALIANADILLLDEPFGALDALTKEDVISFVKEKVKGKTVIFVTHDPAEAALLGDTVISM